MAGAPGAAFVAASLLELQDAPIDVCNFFHGELGGFGIFTEQGVPLKAYQALRAFQSLVGNSSACGNARCRCWKAGLRRRTQHGRARGDACW